MNQTAQGLAALGRGPDTQLVHMTGGEVAGLQALAKAHGGSLSINPATGLPEAGFLSSILPMVIGAGLTVASGGTLTPLMAGMMTAGGYGLATGSLSKGLMAGLGAYGGAGLTGGLMGAGTGALSSAAGAAVPEAAAGSIVPQAALPAATAAAPTATAAGADIFGGTASEIALANGYPAVGTVPMPPATLAAQGVQTVTPQLDFANAYSQDQAMQNAVAQKLASTTPMQTMGAGLQSAYNAPGAFLKSNMMPLGAMGISALGSMEPAALNAPEQSKGMIRPYTYSREKIPRAFEDVAGAPLSSKERRYFTDQYTAGKPYAAPGPEYMANGGTVETMSNANAIGASTGFPQSNIRTGAYSVPFQQPMGQNVVTGAQDAAVDPYTGQAQFADGGPVVAKYGFGGILGSVVANNPELMAQFQAANNVGGYGYNPATGQYFNKGASSDYESGNVGGYSYNPATQQYVQSAVTPAGQARRDAATAQATPAPDSGYAQGGGISDLGSYSDGGRLLRGPGDGVSDNIPAMIGKKQPARLADGEFVVPARIVSELGNGSTEAGARQLYAMMDRVQKNRKKSIGKDKVAADSKSSRLLPA